MKIDNSLDKINEKSRYYRSTYLKPIISGLDILGFTPNSLSFLRAVSGLLFFLLININFEIAFLILIIGGFTDFFDGALARYQKNDSDRGKFIDMLSDNIVFSFFLLGLIKINFITTLNLAYFIFIIPALYLMIIINKNENIKKDWIISPYARISYYKVIFEIAFLITLLLQINKIYITFTSTILNILMSIHFSYHFYLFLNKKQK
jgi:CDP-diacylglycerol--glycerol-3-phosphate 3-phosphatidyltransferase